MRPWGFCSYVTEEGRNSYGEWYSSVGVDVQAAVDRVMVKLRGIDDWANPERKEFKALVGRHAPLSELRFRRDIEDPPGRVLEKRKYRIVGLLRPFSRDFVVFGGARKLAVGVLDPAGAFDR